jgi:putative YhbY family RNA-binding protein
MVFPGRMAPTDKIYGMKTLHSSQKRELRARAHKLRPVVMIGDDGLTPGVLAEIDRSLKSHELIKIRVLAGDHGQRALLLNGICDQASAQAVQHIGRILVVYRERPAEPARPGTARPASARAAPPARRQARGAAAQGQRAAATPRSRASSSREQQRERPGRVSARPPRRAARAR